MPTKKAAQKVTNKNDDKKENKKNDKKVDKKEDKKVDKKEDKKTKGGAKAADDPDMGSEDDYETDDQSNVDEDETEEVVVAGKEANSDDDLEQKEETDEEQEEEEEEEEPEEEQEEVQGDGEEGCIYRFTGKKKKAVDILADFEAEDDFSDDDDKNIDTTKYVDPDKRLTKNFMTIYERVRLLGERAKQLSLGAKPMIKNVDNMNPKDVAKLELENKVIPLIIIRTLPNGVKEKWKVTELEIIN
jgi:DNA-directed RNA polymerase subunit K/omega